MYCHARAQRQHHHPMKVSETPFRKLNGDPLRIFHSVLYSALPPFLLIAASSYSGLRTRPQPRIRRRSYPSGDPSASFKAKPSTSHGNATDFVRGEPYSASHPTHGKPSPSAQGAFSPSVRGQPQTLKIYGLHLSHKEKEKSVAAQEQEDTFAQAKQSSFDKSNSSEKSKTSVPFTAKLCIALLILVVAVAIITYIRRHGSGKRIHFGRRRPQS